MDPGTILAILTASATALKCARSLYDAFYGDETSRHRLVELTERLEALRRAAKHAQTLDTDGVAGFSSITKTIKDCEKFLREYAAGASSGSGARATIQRARLGTLDAAKVKDFHERFNRHILDLWSLNTEQQARHRSTGLAVPSRTDTSLTGATLLDNDDQLTEVSASSHKGKSKARQASVSPSYPQEKGAQPESQALIAPQSRSSLPGSYGRLSYEPSPYTYSEPGYDTTTPYAPSNASSVGSASQSQNWVTISISSGTYSFSSNRYQETTSPTPGYGAIEWSNDTQTLWHHVPIGTRGIPFTVPGVMNFSFLPTSKQHWVQVRQGNVPNGGGSWENPRYDFGSPYARDRFQASLRGFGSVESFYALRVSGHLKTLAEDVEVKLWTPISADLPATISFARNKGSMDGWKHEEFRVAWFHSEPKKRSGSGGSISVTLRVRSEESQQSRRSSTSSKKHSGFFHVPTSSSRKSSTVSTTSTPTALNSSVIPTTLQEWALLEIVFPQDSGPFCTAWQSLCRRSSVSLSARNSMSAVGGSSVSPSPMISPQLPPNEQQPSMTDMLRGMQYSELSPPILEEDETPNYVGLHPGFLDYDLQRQPTIVNGDALQDEPDVSPKLKLLM